MYRVSFDGSTKPGVNGAERGRGFSVCSFCIMNGEEIIYEESLPVGILNNNEAEYIEFIHSLLKLIQMGIKRVTIYTDNQIVFNHIYKIKQVTENSSLYKFYLKACELIQNFVDWKLIWVPRCENQYADRLCKKAQQQAFKRWNEVLLELEKQVPIIA